MKNETYSEKKTNTITFILSTSSKVGTINAKKLCYYIITRPESAFISLLMYNPCSLKKW